MLIRLILLLTVVPFVELAILLRLAQAITWRSTLLIVIVTGVVGAWLARREGLRTLRNIQADMAAGRPPTQSLVEGVMILVAGVVLVTPGILTDMVGFALLVPPIRRWAARRAAELFRSRIVVVHPHGVEPFVDVAAYGRDANSTERGSDGAPAELPDSKGTP